MKGLDKLTSIRLAEALTQKGAVPNEVITDALYSQDRHGESFVESLVESGKITEWDLAKLVVEHFQVPFLMASSYDVAEDVKSVIPKELMFRHMLVPLDKLGDILTVAMPILTPFEILMQVRKATQCDVFPYVGLISENRKVLGERFADYFPWAKARLEERERARQRRATPQSASGGASEDDWQNIFDTGDAHVQDGLRRP
ncbi:MAG: hypothetical protein IPM29_31590 [Planctomycetes bacterium]|nr:hypothetical protein [Planctomycetota bacterium]